MDIKCPVNKKGKYYDIYERTCVISFMCILIFGLLLSINLVHYIGSDLEFNNYGNGIITNIKYLYDEDNIKYSIIQVKYPLSEQKYVNWSDKNYYSRYDNELKLNNTISISYNDSGFIVASKKSAEFRQTFSKINFISRVIFISILLLCTILFITSCILLFINVKKI